MSTTTHQEPTIDVRMIPPRERHPLIFGTFDELAPGDSLLLINDHDPKPLFYQFQAESKGEFSWEYLQQGPEVWQVRIGKISQGTQAHRAPPASCCHH